MIIQIWELCLLNLMKESESHNRSLVFTKKLRQDQDQVLRALSFLGLTTVKEISASLSKKEGNLFSTMVT